MDCAGLIPVDTHVFQISQKFGFIKKTQNLNEAIYKQITDAFVTKYGDKAGWAHQILFAGDLASFREKIADSQAETQATENLETP